MPSSRKRRRSRNRAGLFKRYWIIVVYAAFFLALNWPVLPFVNRVEPRVAHLPFFVFWCLLWSLLVAVVHAVYVLGRTEPGEKLDGSGPEGRGQ